jgi:hypothetical protein
VERHPVFLVLKPLMPAFENKFLIAATLANLLFAKDQDKYLATDYTDDTDSELPENGFTTHRRVGTRYGFHRT